MALKARRPSENRSNIVQPEGKKLNSSMEIMVSLPLNAAFLSLINRTFVCCSRS